MLKKIDPQLIRRAVWMPCMLALGASAQQNQWTGGGGNDDWSNAANWTIGVPNSGANPGGVLLDGTGGGVLAASEVVAASIHGGLTQVWIQNGHTVTQTAGTLQTTGGHHIMIGDAGTATYIQNGGLMGPTGNSVRVGRDGSGAGYFIKNGGTTTIGGTFFVGGDDNGTLQGTGSTDGGAGTFIQDGGTTTVNNFHFGRSSGATGYVEVNGGTFSSPGGGSIGQNGSATLRIDGGAWTQGSNSSVGQNAGGTGVVTVDSGSYTYTGGAGLTLGSNAAGTLNINGGSFIMSTGTLHTGLNGNTATGVINQTGGTVTLGGNAGNSIILGSRGTGTYNLSGGTMDLTRQIRLSGNNSGVGTGFFAMTGGTINASQEIRVGHVGNGTFTMSEAAGASTINLSGNGYLNVGVGPSGTGTFIQSAGEVNTDRVNLVTNGGGTARYDLDGGILRTDSITYSGASAFNWGAAEIEVRSNNAEGTVEDFSSAGFNVVRVGTELDVGGTISSSASGSTLDLGSIFINSGTRFNQMTVAGDLTLSGSDTLEFAANPYLLRPNIGLAIETGSLVLVDVTGTLTGTFDTLAGVQTDLIGWSEYTGAFTGVDDLPTNSWFLEQNVGTGEITFHYKVEGTVPEPGTVGLLALGILLVRRLRSLRGCNPKEAAVSDCDPVAARGFYS